MATIKNMSTVQSEARAALVNQLNLADFPYQVGQSEFGLYVTVQRSEGVEVEVPVTVKVTAHKFEGESAYDLPFEDEGYHQDRENAKAKAEARKVKAAEAKAKREAEKAAKAAEREARKAKREAEKAEAAEATVK